MPPSTALERPALYSQEFSIFRRNTGGKSAEGYGKGEGKGPSERQKRRGRISSAAWLWLSGNSSCMVGRSIYISAGRGTYFERVLFIYFIQGERVRGEAEIKFSLRTARGGLSYASRSVPPSLRGLIFGASSVHTYIHVYTHVRIDGRGSRRHGMRLAVGSFASLNHGLNKIAC